MIVVRVRCPAELSAAVMAVFEANPEISGLARYADASVIPSGDVIEADVPREAANDIVDALTALGVETAGTIQLLPVQTWISERGLAAERISNGAGGDAVVWSEVVERAYAESALTWTFISFMILATLLAGIAVVTDSVILVIGAMVLGPEFVPIAALGVSIVRRRPRLLAQAVRTLMIGFAAAVLTVAGLAAIARAAGLIAPNDLATELRPGLEFIFSPSAWSLIIAVVAGAAGVLALTSAKSGALTGVFISVTTIPAAGNIAVASVFGLWHEVWGSALTLVINITGMALAGWATLAVQQSMTARTRRHRN